MAPSNPYSAPAVEPAPPDVPRIDWELFYRLAWAAAFGLNTIVPGMIGSMFVEDHGRWGVVAAVVALFLFGWYALRACRGWAGPMAVGAFAVAATQVLYVPQIMAGALGVAVAQQLGMWSEPPPRFTGEAGGFVAAFVTGGLLMTAAVLIGLPFRLVFRRKRRAAP